MPHPTSIDKYQIIKPLGNGKFGQVYHAFDRALKAEKALKLLNVTDPAQYLGALKEAQILKRCYHKHIVAINEANIFPVNGVPRLILDLEYIAEGSLESAIGARWISIRDSVTYLRGALTGLEYAHSQNFLHRDIKPANILLAPNAPKLSDFGLATQQGPGTAGSGQGYLTHLPPEFFVSGATSEQTDVFAAGVTLYRVVANISDWKAVVNSIPNIDQHIENGTLIQSIGFEGHIPMPVQRVIRKACAADPTKRYSSAHVFRQKLDQLRFAVDWIKDTSGVWVGSADHNRYEAHVESTRNVLVVTRNGRRVNNLCGKYASRSEAYQALHRHVADTSMAH